MKKVLAFLFAMAVGIGMVFANGAQESASDNGVKRTDNLPSVTWKISHTQTPDHYENLALESMAKEVSEKTNGKFKIEIYHSGTLGAEQEVIENMQMGTIAGNIGSTNLIGNFVPCFNMFSLPALFSSPEQYSEFLGDPDVFGHMQSDCEERNIKLYGSFQKYFRQLYTKTKVENLEDFKALKIRVMGSQILVDTFNALGANPTTTAWGELYSALQLGVCDGLDHVATSVKSMAFYENLKYVCEPALFPTPMFFIVSKPLYDKLPDQYKTIFDNAVANILMPKLQEGDQINQNDLEWLTTEGNLTYVKCDVDAIHKAVRSVSLKYLKELPEWCQVAMHDKLGF